MDDDFEDYPAVLCFAEVCDILCVSRNTCLLYTSDAADDLGAV